MVKSTHRRRHRTETTERRARGGRPVEEVGALPQRAAVGHGPRGLQRATATPGTTSPTTSRARAPTAGARTASAGSRDDKQRLCFALALWNERDPILKERLFGLTNSEGNHGEDVKEYYFYIDSTPTHSYMKYLYKYPQREFPYGDLVETNRRRSREEFEYELLDTGVFDDDRYFDVFVEYAKAAPEDILIRITVHNRGPEAARLHVLPTLWFRNTWSWGDDDRKPSLRAGRAGVDRGLASRARRRTRCPATGRRSCCSPRTRATRSVSGASRTPSPYVKDAFHRYVVSGSSDAVNPAQTGTKAAAHYVLDVPAGGSQIVRAAADGGRGAPSAFSGFDADRSRAGSPTPTSSTSGSRRSSLERGRAARPPPGARRDAVEQAVLLLRPRQWLSEHQQPSAARVRAARRAEHRVVPHAQRRHHLDAGQVGVPVVRGLGPGVPHGRRWRSWTSTSRRSSCC